MTEVSKKFVEDKGKQSLDSSVREIRDTNKMRLPLMAELKLTGIEYSLKDIFQELALSAVDTDDLSDMSERERDFWAEFVVYETNGTGWDSSKNSQYYVLDQVFMALYNEV